MTKYEVNMESNNENDLNKTLQELYNNEAITYTLVCISWYQQLTEEDGHYFI